MIIVDSHVHIYSCFNIEQFLNKASENFRDSLNNDQSNAEMVLVLTEGKNENFFRQFIENSVQVNGWSFRRTKETISLIAESVTSDKIYLIAGSQLTTAENLEVLSIGTDKIEDDLPLHIAIEKINNQAGVAVIPWGFGKWWGKRGKILKNYLVKTNSELFFLGDNGGRPNLLKPAHFNIANQHGIKILPGSDPLPLNTETGRAGTLGFILDGTLGDDCPGTELKKKLISLDRSPSVSGGYSSIAGFLKRQIALRSKP